MNIVGNDGCFVKERTNHVLHAVLSLFACGLWLPVWAFIGFTNTRAPFRCSSCGSEEDEYEVTDTDASDAPAWMTKEPIRSTDSEFPWLNENK